MKNIYAGNYGEDFNDIADAMATVAQNADNLDPSNIEKLTKTRLFCEIHSAMKSTKPCGRLIC